ncbi:MAG: MATE family efflux transporter [Clostridia bacterium]|nr:MATE family efflux transporter [Clostridia bacterium]
MENVERNRAQYIKMTQTPIPKLISKLAVPTTISMLVTSVYNLADTYFVSKISTSASSAVGVVFSLMTIIQAAGFTLGMGAGSLLARRLGEKNKKAADEYASTAFYTSLALGLIITVFGQLFKEELMTLLGATETNYEFAADYGNYILWAAPIMCASFVMNNILRSEGKAALSMIGLSVGGILNIILDPIFIFTFNLQTAGAAIATVISQFMSFVLLLSMFLFRKSNISLSPKNIVFKPKIYAEILTTGMPSLSRQGLASVATVLLNRAAGVYGDAAIAAMSIVAKVCMLVQCVCIGVGQGFMPVAGFNYGAKKFDRVKKAFRFTLTADTIIMACLGVAIFIFAPTIMKLFRAEDATVVEIGSAAMRAQCIAMPLMSMTIVANSLLQSVGKSVRATILSCCRQGIFFIPLILVLPKFFGLWGIEYTQAIADALTFLISLPFVIWFFKGLKNEQKSATADVND